MDITNEKFQDYAEQHTSPEDPLLQKINRDTYANFLYPRMLSGHLQGRMLSMLSKMIRPRFILEIGTYTGYSALCLAEGLQPDGKLTTIDINEELEGRTTASFAESLYSAMIDFRIGDAQEIIPQLDNQFDLVFIDADKENYSNYYELVLQKVNKGGYILADNVLWSGKVLNEPEKTDIETERLREFNKMITKDDRVENVLLPIRDGIMVIRKLV
ncbi:MAG: class I SAM-dependent methyltransferase [Bacteroidetes bacterium]|nr:class I SAM-dependent methyltransferase [Bacteroidota bacterium]MDA1122321.1 class I SAM-dependent methyltransferase [Bacteroidota bacterium]